MESRIYRLSSALTRGALLLTLVFGTFSALPWTEPAYGDDRVLRVQDGNRVQAYAVNQLIADVGLTELRLAKDPHFGPDRVFAGFSLVPLLRHVGLGDARELLLVCADGYRIPFETSTLLQPHLRGLLALRDTALPANGDTH